MDCPNVKTFDTSQNGHIHVAELILKEDVDIYIQEESGCTALMVVRQNGHIHVAKLLVKEDADINIQEEDGYTALILACQNGLSIKWLHVHPDASWQDVLSALEKSQEYTLASKVYQKINTTSSTTTSISQGISYCNKKTIQLLYVGFRISQEKVKVESEEKEKEVLTASQSLQRDFSKLMVAVRSSLDHKLQHQQLVLVDVTTWMKYRLHWVKELSDINKCNDLDDLFKTVHPYFDFLDCGLIVDMSEEFLNDESFGKNKKDLVGEFKEYIVKAESLRYSSTVKELKAQLKTIYSPYLTNLSNMPQIQIELHNPWNKANIEGLYLLIGHLLPHRSKQSILKYIEIETGSVRIKYIVHESKAECLIAYAKGKLQFMHFIGIFSLTINDEAILKEDKNMNFTFESALLEAANSGHDEAVQFLLKLRVDADHCNEKGRTALMIASKNGHENVVQTLVSAGTNVNIQDNEGRTALTTACEHDYVAIVDTLIQTGANPNLQISDGSTALMVASFYGYSNIIKVLLKKITNFQKINYPKQLEVGVDVNIQKEDGWNALILASYNNHTEIVELLLKENADINIQAKSGVTALMQASVNGHTQVVEQLIQKHADVNIQEENGWTALMLASLSSCLQTIELLLKGHANIDIQAKSGKTALMIASQYGHIQVVKLLLKKHADVNIQEEDGWTALMFASQNGHIQVVELLKHHTNVNIHANDDCTALMIASQNGHTQVVEQLLKQHADVNIQAENGVTALTKASRNGHLEVAECLLQSHADPHIIAYNGATALSSAALSGNRDLVNMLLDKAEPTTAEIEKAVVTSCLGGFPTLITFLSNKLTYLTNDQRELLDACVKGEINITRTLDHPDTPLVLGLTPLMVASSCGHVDIVDALIQAGADVNKQESYWGFTSLFFAVRSGKSALIVKTLLKSGANPNVIVYFNTALDVAIEDKQENMCELLTKYGGQTKTQLQETNKSERTSSSLTSGEVTMAVKPLVTTTNSDLSYIDTQSNKDSITKKAKQKKLRLPNFKSIFSILTPYILNPSHAFSDTSAKKDNKKKVKQVIIL